MMYRDILEAYIFKMVDYYRIDRERIAFQEDNEPKQTCKLAKNWTRDYQMNVLDCPAQCSDLN